MEPELGVMIGVLAEIVRLSGLTDLVAICVQIHFIPAHIGVNTRGIFKGGIFRGKSRILSVVGTTISAICAIMFYVVPGAGTGFHIIAGYMRIFTNGLSVIGVVKIGRTGAGRIVFFGIQCAIIRVDINSEFYRRPTSIKSEIVIGHGCHNYIFLPIKLRDFFGIWVLKENTDRTILIKIPAGKAVDLIAGIRFPS